MQPIEAGEVDIAAVHHVDGTGFRDQQIKHIGVIVSLTALMEPPVFGVMGPLTGADFEVSDGVIIPSFSLPWQ